MIKRLYIHNFRCLENFELTLTGLPSILLLGRNGAGKTTVGLALEVLQKIARANNRVGGLVEPSDLGRTDVPVRFEVEAVVKERNFTYSIAFDFPAGFRELRVAEERLIVDGEPVFTREFAQVRLARSGHSREAAFGIDWHLVALPIVQEQNSDDPLAIFKGWVRNILILRPVPSLVRGDSDQNASMSHVPDTQATNIGAWFYNIISASPAAYSRIMDYLVHVMPDLAELTNELFGKETRSLVFHFRKKPRELKLFVEQLSDGEKCFVIYALTMAANAVSGPVLCFWDEPDNFLAPNEIADSIMALRAAFQDGGQLILTSHNPEAIRSFSENNTFQLFRNSHFEAPRIRSVEAILESNKFGDGFIDALVRGDLEE